MRAAAPRNDIARIVEWDLSSIAGRRAYLEIVDGDEEGAYAWLAVGRFDPPVISVPEIAPSRGSQRLASCAATVQRFALSELKTELEGVLLRSDLDSPAAGVVASAVLSFHPDARYEAIAVAIGEGQLNEAFESTARQAIIQRDDEKLPDLAMTVMQNAAGRTQLNIATTMVGDLPGAQLLLELVRSGRASPRLLQSAAVAERLKALRDQATLDQAQELLASLPPASEGIDRMIAQRRLEFGNVPRSLEKGGEVFTKSCIACHQLAGKGAMVGPQLDGIGNRGIDRLLEDMLDPHRNVDVAFRTTTLILTNGKIVSGLVRREEGSALVLVDDKGQEFTVNKEDIDEQSRTTLSLMPENVATSLSAEDFFNLLAFLLAQRGESGAK